MNRLGRGGNRVFAIAILLLTVALAAVAVLEYRWIARVSEAERREQAERAEAFAQGVAAAIGEELMRTFDAFAAPENQPVFPTYQRWRRETSHPKLVETVFVAERTGDDWSLHRLDLGTRELEPIPWPPYFESVRRKIATLDPRGPNAKWPPPLFAKMPGLFIVQRPAPMTPDFLHGVPHRVVFLQMNDEALQSMVQAAASRQPQRASFHYALAAGDRVLARASSEWPRDGVPEDASATVPRIRVALRPYRTPAAAEGEWTVRVHRAGGGLAAVLSSAHQRNVAVSAAIFLILAASVSMLLALIRRGQRLRAQQAAFVTMMTHELNTPVAVLRGAGENLRDGIVADPAQVRAYGSAIVSEAERLRGLTEDIVDVAGLRPRAAQRPMRDVAIAPLVQSTVDRCRLLPNDPPLEIEVRVEDDLPPMRGDEQSLSRAIENLITNAIRHASAGGWIGVHARREAGGVAITVEDRGPGIASADAAHLFEPFHRGSAAEFIEGAGLGLAIVRHIATSHGGSIVLEPRTKGAAFTLHLPGASRG